MEDFDPAYIVSKEHRPELSNNVFNVDENPIIDLSESNQQELISKIGKACQEWGFFQVINHGVPFEVSSKVEIEAKKFFEQSLEEKKKVKRVEANATGYHDGEHTKNIRDWKEVFDFLIEDAVQVPSSHEPHDMELWTLKNQWPQSLPHFRETMEEYGRELEKLSYKLLELISLSLGLSSHKFNDCFKNQLSLVRLNRYPPCPFPDLALGVGPHVDSNVLTVLAQDDIGGLQVKRKSTGDWIGVKPISSAFVVNLGEIFQVWSNDKYEAAEHRVVVNSKKERFSYPFFLTTSHHTMVKPAEELVSEQDPAKYKTFNVGKYHAYITSGDFSKQEVESNRINYFKISD
ncbi:gibberellin 20 oxidase 1-like protein [Trifolium pratense]|uniref:Gibberellin 20 oxidase 1-like protein n=1 Tax=Trifolium pratense TaxID=57577 RepID=A0A2K3L297_TRIPR|nr:gibberellin 20 oxidase 1-like protein [Trifolium pratense]PNX95816.1 gibberellin 20 oxidase 1-like protein [Trifolium pratense]